jgi:iron complex transport system permease protein
VIFASLFVGPTDSVSAGAIWQSLFTPAQVSPDESPAPSALAEAVLWNVRLPRILLAFLVGAALTVSGTALQALTRNPLVSPDIVGLSSGAAFGAALALALGWLPLQVSAFLFGLLAALLSVFLAASRRGLSVLNLVLGGIIVGALFTSLLTLVQISTDPFKLQSIVHWTMGNLHNASWSKLSSAWLPILGGSLLLFWLRWRLNAIALGDEEMQAVGLNPAREKLFILLPSVLLASSSVAVAGIIGMVSLAVPHLIRMMVGANNRHTVPVSLTFGGSFLVLVDTLARSITTFEVPVGIFTTLVGGPFFIYLLKRHGAAFGDE